MRRRILPVVIILVVALGPVVLADPPTLTIQQQATLDPSNFGVLVTVAVNCGPSAPTSFELVMAVRQGDVSGPGDEVFPATGGRQVVSILVFGPFNPGDASASGGVVCGGVLTEGLTFGTQIKISQ